jgi:hypothetical protein
VNGQFHAPAALFPGKESPVPIGYSVEGPQNRSERGGEEFPVPHRESNPGTPIVQPVASWYNKWDTPGFKISRLFSIT